MTYTPLHAENTLLTQVAAGDEQAFKTLFSTYYQQLFNYISGFVKSKQVAEELVMDAFLKIWQGRDLLPEIRNFDAFLFRVARNKSIDFLRSAARDPQFEDLLWDAMQLTTDDEDSAALMQELEVRLREAIGMMPPQRKKVYQLSREQEMTHEQIAAQLNLSRHTINNHIVEAQRFIRTYLSKNCDIAFLLLVLPLLFT